MFPEMFLLKGASKFDIRAKMVLRYNEPSKFQNISPKNALPRLKMIQESNLDHPEFLQSYVIVVVVPS